MKKVVLTTFILLTLVGCNANAEQQQPVNNIADGNVTETEARAMQDAWCDHNEGKDFAEEQCK